MRDDLAQSCINVNLILVTTRNRSVKLAGLNQASKVLT